MKIKNFLFYFRMSAAYNTRRNSTSHANEPLCLLLKIYPSGEYAIAAPKSCTKYTGDRIDQLNNSKLVTHGYGINKVVAEVVRQGIASELKSYLSVNSLALPSDKENNPPSKNYRKNLKNFQFVSKLSILLWFFRKS
jgi:hypothetical protein